MIKANFAEKQVGDFVAVNANDNDFH